MRPGFKEEYGCPLGVALVTWVVFYVRCLLPAAPSPAEARQPKVRDPQNFAVFFFESVQIQIFQRWGGAVPVL